MGRKKIEEQDDVFIINLILETRSKKNHSFITNFVNSLKGVTLKHNSCSIKVEEKKSFFGGKKEDKKDKPVKEVNKKIEEHTINELDEEKVFY